MRIRPLHDRIVVKRVEEQEVLPTGIVIPDTAKEKPQKAVVLAVGTGKRLESGAVVPLDVRAGDEILLGKFSGTEIVVDGEDLLVLREGDVLAVVESAAEEKKAA
jgi:chaperonin GroES